MSVEKELLPPTLSNDSMRRATAASKLAQSAIESLHFGSHWGKVIVELIFERGEIVIASVDHKIQVK